MSADTEIKVEDLCSEKKFFSQIPNIIHQMGLGPYAVAYYCLLASLVDNSMECSMSQAKIAKILGCSDRHIRKLNKILSQPFDALGGKPLIHVLRKKCDDGQNLTNTVKLIEICVEASKGE